MRSLRDYTKIVAYLLVLLLPLIVGLIFYYFSDKPRNVISGVADFTSGIHRERTMALNGSWEFFPGQLLTPQEIQKQPAKEFIEVPTSWTKQPVNQGKPLPALSCGTYHMKILLPSSQKVGYALSTTIIRTAHKIFIDGKQLMHSDEPPGLNENFMADTRPEVYYFEGSGEVDLVIQASNSAYDNLGGIIEPIKFGNVYSVTNEKLGQMASNIAVIAIYICVLLIFSGQFLQRYKQYELLYFSGFCLFQMILALCEDFRLILRLFPTMSFAFYTKLALLSGLAAMNFLAGYIWFALYRSRFYKILWILSIGSAGIALFVFAAPIELVSKYVSVLLLWALLLLLFVIGAMIHAIIRKVDGYNYLVVGVACFLWLFIAAIAETFGMFASHWINTLVVAMFLVSQLLFITERHKQIELRERTEATELAYLRAQINPHFIYNALGSIAGLIMEDAAKARDTLVSFSDYLRKMFKSDITKQLTTVEEELFLSEDYLAIEKVRFGGRLKIVFDVPDSMQKLLIPPLSIQPIVENAVKHGMLSKSVLQLIVKGDVNDDRAVITVQDNGPGVDQKKLEQILSGSSKGVGLCNSRTRLLRHGGDMQFYSSDAGLTVHIILPVKR